ncbi:hypothetical protein KAR91_18580 [Candidatus Pacearchaeota archaeon]|nr:hypothetical protein [Candidatus Pacearchaeota archaeon]
MAGVGFNLWKLNRNLTINMTMHAPHMKIRFFFARLFMKAIEFKKAD